ncbi:hypothetical protein GCM10010435_93320 [Winogradskya consettensis]|uniref:Enoyl reductase (ER) domain-containing protein n=1 Tax=Winogradskya consettensis TaxID=113560 RepID=A0A919T2H2_9ACTN|nr:zinc-binding dehydrogenase [Actinoplanes consettensis]GIM85272.1 hypothetical protein Aco04nite_95510 [Actinoplanes consettensis]
MDREILEHFFQVRQDVATRHRISPVLELIAGHLPHCPATVFSRFGEVLLQTRPAIALFGDYTRTGGSSHFMVDRWLSDPSARERFLVEVGVPVRHRPRRYRHVALGEVELYRHLLLYPAEHQMLLFFTAVPGSVSHSKLRALAAGSKNKDSSHHNHSRRMRFVMKAVRFHEYGAPEVLRYEDVDQPVPAAGEVRIRVAATSFNPVEGNIRSGVMRGPIAIQLPHTPGIDIAGTVDALGEDVTGLAVGDRVIGALPLTSPGAAAEYVIAPAGILAAAPTSVPLVDAAGLPLVGLTAWQALFEHAKLTAGQRVLINGAGGVVGGYAVQLAKNAGAYVIATTGPRSSEQAKVAGADEIHGPGIPELSEPVDVVLNFAPIDPEQMAALSGVIRDGGVLVNTTVWMPAASDDARGVRGINLFFRPDADQLTQLVTLLDAGKLRLGATRRVPLVDVAQVHAEVAAEPLNGKVVFVPATSER